MKTGRLATTHSDVTVFLKREKPGRDRRDRHGAATGRLCSRPQDAHRQTFPPLPALSPLSHNVNYVNFKNGSHAVRMQDAPGTPAVVAIGFRDIRPLFQRTIDGNTWPRRFSVQAI